MPAENIYDLGDDPTIGYTLRNDVGSLVDGTVAANSIDPAGASVALVASRISKGTYETRLKPLVGGRWLVRFTATGAYSDSETVGLVFRPNAPARSDDAYATIDDVIRFTQGRTFNASSKPSTPDVQDYLNFSKGEIDGLLRRGGYDLPVATVATGALALLAHGNALGAACLVETSAPIANRQSQVCRLYADFKKMVLAGDLELDAGKDESNSAPRSNAANQATAIFRRDMIDYGGRDW
jgi:hypothetical protein